MFLWSGQKDGKYNALVKWETVQKPKDKGGLGVADLLLKNAVLLLKWWWRYACDDGVLSREIINFVHDEDLAILPDNSRSNIPGPWQEIKRLAREKCAVMQAFFSAYKTTIRR